MKKSILGIVFLLIASFGIFLTSYFLREGIDEQLIFMAILLFPFAWLATVIYCKFFAPHVRKRVAGLTIFSVFFITTLFYALVQEEIEQKRYAERYNKCIEACLHYPDPDVV